MQRVFVLDSHRQPLMPCAPARARQLLARGRAAVYRRAAAPPAWPWWLRSTGVVTFCGPPS